jgi:TetR/AcrR family transcriptional repressor of nem operon
MASPHDRVSAKAGRPRGFSREAALASALTTLWRRGYEATSIDDLTRAMGLNRSSFYACFASKHAVMIEAVQTFADELFERLTAIADAEPDPRRAALGMLTAIVNPGNGQDGCFFVNSVTELAAVDPALAVLARAHIGRVTELMTRTLARLRCGPEIAAERAGAMLAIAIGACVLAKTGLPPAALVRLLAQADSLVPLSISTEGA